MLFRCKYLVAGMAPASELYQFTKTQLQLQRNQVCDIIEYEVLGPYPEPDNRIYSVVPVTVKIESTGYEGENTILFDILSNLYNIRDDFAEQDFWVGLEEIVVDGVRFPLAREYMIAAHHGCEL